jgi:hypothetical protein
MANKINTVPSLKPDTDEPTVIDNSTNPEAVEEKKVDRIADRAAHKANKTEQKYDEDHTIFSN